MTSPYDPSYKHKYVNLKNGVRLHYVDVGPRDGIPMLLLHGWPDLWWGWRHQIQHFRAKYRLIVPDQPGFGATTSPDDFTKYTRKTVAAGYADLLDILEIEKAIVIGHDWGGMTAWCMALFEPSRVLAVGSICTPFWDVVPQGLTLEDFVAIFPSLTYQLYLVQDGTAAAFEANPHKFFQLVYGCKQLRRPASATNVRSAMEALAEFEFDPETPRTNFSKTDLQFMVDEYMRQGFQHGLNWYKTCELDNQDKMHVDVVVPHEALFVSAGRDQALLPSMSKGMETLVPNLVRGHVEEASHWILWETPEKVNAIIESWLDTVTAKLKLV
ncbi:hypothetical protein SPRG_06039 [Saprolegnia parasitica CBS 223.65]|uniref:AB hydrolase-1 domain-containing protein n=1 Tax=Saprolegnia parasitica (strain CBS 223.65) TaxID=695850 RepID=A0A067CFF9_SAPPC|nr:hypothetical protein SPRG_06039 [Saprolegnia parasitica CBS 223.65]KDO29499.1 hypothetical protein SPRG_06039 [Saprolegnia parasitica CBS 223.65]|eukprot:XP_012199995.1 hypothetical protein SPRG_06039 [Saprolegnia parasitica CBS 223.65]